LQPTKVDDIIKFVVLKEPKSVTLTYFIVAFLLGLAVGVLSVWLIAAARRAQAIAEAESQSRATTAGLCERLSLKQQELEALQREKTELESKVGELSSDLIRETGDRSAAMERANRVPLLESQLKEKEVEEDCLRDQISSLRTGKREVEILLQEERKSAQQKLNLLQEATENLQNAFKALSADALKSNNQSFLELAKTTLEKFQSEAKGELEQRQKAVENLVTPIRETLEKYEEQLHSIEKSRTEAYSGLTQQVHSLLLSQQRLQTETGNLVKALRTPHVRGRWGEMALRKVVELAGMTEYCDFIEQPSVSTEVGRVRPDMIVKLPAGKNIVIDSKVPLQAYLDALNVDDEESRRTYLRTHAKQVRQHLQNLSSKAYWEQFEPTPEFVILFIPGESFYSAALDQDPKLFEEGVNQNVILATPGTLIALLKAVAYGWRQEKIAENAQLISELGKSLYERLLTLARHFDDVGSNLEKSVDAYNRAVGSLETRVLVAARKFKELGISPQADVLELTRIEKKSREIQAAELLMPTSWENVENS
jgi:DNA recombination protein RmuC